MSEASGDNPTDGDGDGVVVPCDSLDATTLRRVVEEFVTREGTDYGHVDRNLDDKVKSVLLQLRRGEADILFDPQTGSIGIVARTER